MKRGSGGLDGARCNLRPSAVSASRNLASLPMAVAIIGMISLSGCATQSPQVVKVPYAIPCLTADQLPAAPKAKTDAELAKLDDFQLVINLAADRLEYRRHSNELSAVISACVR